MRERKTQLDTYRLHDRSLNDWHEFLTHDKETGEYTGYLAVPCSRYGSDSRRCAWFAVACEVVYVDANGKDDEPEEALEYLMGLAVNDHPDVAEIVVDSWQIIPRGLRRVLGTKKEVRGLL